MSTISIYSTPYNRPHYLLLYFQSILSSFRSILHTDLSKIDISNHNMTCYKILHDVVRIQSQGPVGSQAHPSFSAYAPPFCAIINHLTPPAISLTHHPRSFLCGLVHNVCVPRSFLLPFSTRQVHPWKRSLPPPLGSPSQMSASASQHSAWSAWLWQTLPRRRATPSSISLLWWITNGLSRGCNIYLS